jgi:hypothetical protein
MVAEQQPYRAVKCPTCREIKVTSSTHFVCPHCKKDVKVKSCEVLDIEIRPDPFFDL